MTEVSAPNPDAIKSIWESAVTVCGGFEPLVLVVPRDRDGDTWFAEVAAYPGMNIAAQAAPGLFRRLRENGQLVGPCPWIAMAAPALTSWRPLSDPPDSAASVQERYKAGDENVHANLVTYLALIDGSTHTALYRRPLMERVEDAGVLNHPVARDDLGELAQFLLVAANAEA